MGNEMLMRKCCKLLGTRKAFPASLCSVVPRPGVFGGRQQSQGQGQTHLGGGYVRGGDSPAFCQPQPSRGPWRGLWKRQAAWTMTFNLTSKASWE